MNAKTAFLLLVMSTTVAVADDVAPVGNGFYPTQGQTSAPASNGIARRIGSIKTINGNTLTLGQDSGSDVTVAVQPNARVLRIAPGAKDLKDATPVQIQDLQVGDRVRVRGQATGDGNSIDALEVIVMAHSDLEAHRQQEQQDWQKRGTGGLVSAVDPANGTVSISTTGMAGKKTITVHSTKSTVIRRYAPDSVKFDDAKPSTLRDIHPGDQLRARGDRNADGSEMTADEIVTGNFRNIAGTVNSVDASSNTINVQDLITKKVVQIKITSDSQLHKIPAEIAQRIAMRLKGSLPPGTPGAGGASGTPHSEAGAPNGSGAANGDPGAGQSPGGRGGFGGGVRSGAAPDLQQIISRMPASSLSDLHKGDAVLIVATEGSGSAATAITLVSGVEPILQAAPSGSQAMMLAPWSLGGAPGGDASMQ